MAGRIPALSATISMDKALAKGIAKAGIPTARRHLFVCIGPDCCRSREGEMLWEMIKKRVKASGVPVMRTKAGCFRICRDGPLMVVYPEGTWYSHVTPARFERIFRQHVIDGKPVEEWAIAANALTCHGCAIDTPPDHTGEPT